MSWFGNNTSGKKSKNETLDPFEKIDMSELDRSNQELEKATFKLKENASMVIDKIREENSIALIEQFAAFTMQMTDAVVVIDKNNTIVHANNAAENLFKLSLKELKGTDFCNYLINDCCEYAYNHCKPDEVFTLDELFCKKTLCVKSTEKEIPTEVSISSFVTPIGEEYFSIILRNISDRIDYEHKLKKSEAMFRAFLEKSSDGMFIIEKEKFIIVNEALATMLDTSVDDMINKKFLDYIHEDDKELVLSNHYKRLSGDIENEKYVIRLANKSQEFKYAQIDIKLIDDTQDNKWVIGIARDVTEEQINKTRYINKVEYYKCMFCDCSLAINITDENGDIVDVNKTMINLFGYNLQELKGSSVFKLMPANIIHEEKKLYDIAFRDNHQDIKIWTFTKKDGTTLKSLIISNNFLQDEKIHRMNIMIPSGEIIDAVTKL